MIVSATFPGSRPARHSGGKLGSAGILPLLAASKRAFVVVKLINLIVGATVGAVMIAAGS